MSRQTEPLAVRLRKREAERRMRRGERGADIARDLNISISTLTNWAAEGNWRKKDIAFELDEERGKALLAQIAETKKREHEEAERRAARAEELGKAALEAMRAADPEQKGTPPGMKPMTTPQLSLAMAHTLLEQGQIAEAERAARFAQRFAQAQKATNDRDAAQWRADRQRMLDWWNEHREGFQSFHQHATEAIEELRSMVRFERLSREAGLCPTCSRPADFWPAAMDEPKEKAVDRMEEMEMREEEENEEKRGDRNGEDPLEGDWF